MITWTHTATTVAASFSASLVEFVEALTIILAVGLTRGWRSSLMGAVSGLITLIILVLAFGPLLAGGLFPLKWLQIAIGILLLLFGLRWLRKAILRAAGIIPLHDEADIYEKQVQQLGEAAKPKNKFDGPAFITSFKAVLIEGIEVVFIIVAFGAAETSVIPASLGAAAALLLVILLGLMLHTPLTLIPENTLKFFVAVILIAFGLFWIGEGSGFNWPGGDIVIPALISGILVSALSIAGYLKKRTSANTGR